MGKKKKKRGNANDPPPPDPRRVALAGHIDRELAKRDEEEASNRNTLCPLKKVNSNPMIYEFVPMARNMFADSKSVDFGFDGSVDIPNQAIYLEERPDDEDFDKELPEDFPSSMSLGYIYSTDIEDDEFDLLDNMESNDEDFWRFLKARMGKKEFETLQDSDQYQTLLTMPEPSESEDEDDEDTDQKEDAGGWFSFPASVFGGWWGNAEEEKVPVDEIIDPPEDQMALQQERTRTESVVDPPDAIDSPQDRNSTESLEEKSSSTKRRRRTAKEKWLLYRSRMWHKSHRSKDYEKAEDGLGSNATLNGGRGEFLDEEINLGASDIDKEEEKKRKKASTVIKKCLIILLILLAIILVGAAGIVITTYLGVYIPIVSDILFPPQANTTSSTSYSTTNTTSYITTKTTSYDISQVTSSPAFSETTVYETLIESISDIEAIPGVSPSQYERYYPDVHGMMAGHLIELNWEPFDATTFVEVDPPTEEFSNAVGIPLYDAYRFLGFEVGQLTLGTALLGSNVLTLVLITHGRREANLGVMKWYGYRRDDSTSGRNTSQYTRRISILLPKLMKERSGLVINQFSYTVGGEYVNPPVRLVDSIDVQRPPLRVPDSWGNCDGISVCELGDV